MCWVSPARKYITPYEVLCDPEHGRSTPGLKLLSDNGQEQAHRVLTFLRRLRQVLGFLRGEGDLSTDQEYAAAAGRRQLPALKTRRYQRNIGRVGFSWETVDWV